MKVWIVSLSFCIPQTFRQKLHSKSGRKVGVFSFSFQKSRSYPCCLIIPLRVKQNFLSLLLCLAPDWQIFSLKYFSENRFSVVLFRTVLKKIYLFTQPIENRSMNRHKKSSFHSAFPSRRREKNSQGLQGKKPRSIFRVQAFFFHL